MRTTSRGLWSLSGLVAGAAGIVTSYLLASVLSVRESPVVAVAELVVRLTPGPVVEWAIQLLGTWDKTALVVGIVVILAVLFAWVGRLTRERWWAAAVVLGVLALVGGVAVLLGPSAGPVAVLPVALGLVTWIAVLAGLAELVRRVELSGVEADGAEPAAPSPWDLEEQRSSRRTFVLAAAAVAVLSGALGVAGRLLGGGRREVEEARRLLRIEGVSEPDVPADVRVDVDGVTPWVTSAEAFYLIDTTIIKPAIQPTDYRLRIHGLVERELELSYDDLAGREIAEGWITLNCVSNEVGGPLIGNAWWSGVRLRDLLAEAGVDPDADAVLQTSEDGWTCGTPLAALTDDRNAMLALAMNGQPLPVEHGFPVRTIVPGLYGYVSACKWVVDLEVTRFDDISAYWTQRGWGELGPVKMSSRIDVPAAGTEVPAGEVVVAGMAWAQHTGIAGVEVAVDGGPWLPAVLGGAPNDDSWVQWRAAVSLDAGSHLLKVRATDKAGTVQTGAIADVLPDGATGWHEVEVSAVEA